MKILQFGRSMIEMLGVLAIIGVLSIGGLLGYRRAVNNHQANTILDDVNRFAFVVMENDKAFEPNTVITDDFDFVPIGIYHMDAFLGTAAGQFGIVITDVPKGVCEALLPKASAEYKVRVASAKTADNVQQLAAYGVLYDEQSTDICNNTNDIALYFGDTSKQCTSSTGTECTSNADCCGGEFCLFHSPTDCTDAGTGRCEKIVDTDFSPRTETLSDGNTWTHSYGRMNWWSAQNWCTALGLRPIQRADIGCENVPLGGYCNRSSIVQLIQAKWGDYIWLEDYGNSCYADYIHLSDAYVYYTYRYSGISYLHAFCH